MRIDSSCAWCKVTPQEISGVISHRVKVVLEAVCDVPTVEILKWKWQLL